MENWRSHEATSLTFRKGTNLIIGIMGSGKSSVLDAMSFALFALTPTLEHRKLTLGDLIRHGKEHARIRLSIDWKGDRYDILREIRKERKDAVASSAEMRKNGALVEKGQSAVTKYVEQLLQIDYSLFSRAIYSAQNRIDHFLSLEPGKRKDEIDELLGLDRFEAARENSVTLINKMRFARKSLEEKFSRQKLEEMRRKEADAMEKLAKLQNSGNAARLSAENNKVLYGQSSSVFLALKAKKERADALLQNISRARGAIEQISEQLGGKEPDAMRFEELARRKGGIDKAIAEGRNALAELQAKQNQLSKEIGSLENRIEESRKAALGLEKLKSESEKICSGKTPGHLSSQKAALEAELIEAEAGIKQLASEIAKAEQSLSSLSPELSKCPVCMQPLTKESMAHVIGEYNSQIAGNRKKLELLSARRKENTSLHADIQGRLRSLDAMLQKQLLLEKSAAGAPALMQKLAGVREEAIRIQAEARQRKDAGEKLTADFREMSVEYKVLENLLLGRKRLSELQLELEKLEHERAQLEFSEAEFEKSREQCDAQRLAMEKSLMELSSISAQLRDYSELAELAHAEVLALEGLERKVAELAASDDELSLFKNAVLETQTALRTEVIEAINIAMNSIWGVVYPYGDYSRLRISVGERGYSFEIYDTEWRSAELASGGERACIALAFRIALASVLTPNLSMLVLDEPTHNLDKEAVAVLAQAMQYKLPELVEQAFVITHEEGLMGSEFASTYRMRREKNGNGPTLAEEV